MVEQILKGGGSFHGLSDGAKRNHMTPFKGNALSTLWWNLNFFFFFCLSPPQKKKGP